MTRSTILLCLVGVAASARLCGENGEPICKVREAGRVLLNTVL